MMTEVVEPNNGSNSYVQSSFRVFVMLNVTVFGHVTVTLALWSLFISSFFGKIVTSVLGNLANPVN